MVLLDIERKCLYRVRLGGIYHYVTDNKTRIGTVFKNLLLKKPLTKITVGDIAEECGINRMTFYYHFKDIYDLVEWSCLEDAKKALDQGL